MKIAYPGGSIFPSTRASTVHMMKMCAGMVRAGHEVILFGRRSPGYLDTDIFRYYGIDPTFELDLVSSSLGHRVPALAGAARLLIRATQFRPDLYYARRRPLAVVASFGSTPLAFDAHELPITMLHRRMENRIFSSKSFACLVAVTQGLANDYLDLWPQLRSKILVAANGADRASDSITPYTIAKRSGAPQVGYVGSLYPGKGMETIVKLAQRQDMMDFHVVGGDAQQVDYWQKKGCPGNITFHGHVPHAEVPRYLSAFDVALVPVQKRVAIDFDNSDIGKWTSPVKIFEYMAHNLPIIASDTPTVREVLTSERNSILVPPEDLEAWANALRRLTSSPSFAKDLAGRAREDFLSKYTWDARVSTVLRRALGEA
jgi:glycosyltransferase involved in cell wall biosynthesis